MKALIVEDIDNSDTPGAIEFRRAYGRDEIAGIGFRCPCGCGREGWLPFRPEPSPSWEFDGNEGAPTLSPSVLQVGGCQWHGWLRNGDWVAA